MSRLVFLFALVLPGFAGAGEPNAAPHNEISHLISYLADSGCQFHRNGAWYSSTRAADHLKRKYEYLLEKNWAPTTEAFIERAASRSSTSGKPYLVKCADAPAIPSAAWLREELLKFRAAARVQPDAASRRAQPSGV
ncbi:MAG TPA: DUF5329 domain-containing protein [Steroidobacter sp.]|jgi:hypothetical protein|nr:DUF5329 domain-containing protein [Steroidobacter sp.]